MATPKITQTTMLLGELAHIELRIEGPYVEVYYEADYVGCFMWDEFYELVQGLRAKSHPPSQRLEELFKLPVSKGTQVTCDAQPRDIPARTVGPGNRSAEALHYKEDQLQLIVDPNCPRPFLFGGALFDNPKEG